MQICAPDQMLIQCKHTAEEILPGSGSLLRLYLCRGLLSAVTQSYLGVPFKPGQCCFPKHWKAEANYIFISLHIIAHVFQGMAWPDLQTYRHIFSVHESNSINIPLLIPALCLFAAGLGGQILGGMNLGGFLSSRKAKQSWTSVSWVSLQSFGTSSPGEAGESARDRQTSQKGILPRPDILWGVDRGSAAIPTSLLGGRDVKVGGEGRAGSPSKWTLILGPPLDSERD